VTDIIPLPQRTDPHLAGKAVCLGCRHEWVAVAPVGTVALTCPACGTNKGVMLNLVSVEEPMSVWTCNCGCEIFKIVGDANKRFSHVMCLHCGAAQDF
jgi:hypothetical protein